MNTWLRSLLCITIIGASSAVYAQGTIQFMRDNNSPTVGNSGCPNSEVWYVLAWSGYNIQNVVFHVTGSYVPLTPASGSNFSIYKLRWETSGSISVTFDNNGIPDSRSGINFSVTSTEAGAISGPSAVCYGTSGTLSVTGNAGPVSWEYYNTATSSWVAQYTTSTGNLTSARTFRAHYTADNCGTDYTEPHVVNVTPLVQITSGPTLDPSSRYVGDTDPIEATVTATNATSYTWTVKDFSNQTVASPSSTNATTNLIDWSSTHTGSAVVSVTAHGCNSSTDTESTNITINAIPVPQFQRIGNLPATLCAGTVVRYKLASTDPNVEVSSMVPSIIDGGNSSVQNHALDGFPDEWSVTWMVDGSFRVTYTIEQDERTWTNQTLTLPFNVAEAIAGTISFSGPSIMCAGTSQTSGTINISGNSGTVTYWSCTSGCSEVNDGGWDEMGSNAYTNLSVNTRFRAKLDFEDCTTKYSNVLDATVAPMPIDILVNGDEGVCDENPNATIVLNYGEEDVKYRLFKNGIDQSYEIEGPGPPEAGGRIEFGEQGVGTYHVVATKGTCQLQMTGTPEVELLTPAAFSVTTDPVQPIAICPGESVSFEAVNGSALQWSSTRNDLEPEQMSASSFIITPEDDATYSVIGEDVNCHLPVNQSIAVDVRSNPSVTLDPLPDEIVCVSTPAFELSASPSGGLWKVDGVSSTDTFTAANHHTTPTQESSNHTITYSYTDQYGCVGSGNQSITIRNPQPPAEITFTVEYEEELEAVMSAGTYVTYKWYENSSGGSSFHTGTEYPTAPITSQTTYYLATVRQDLPSCEGTLRGPLIINHLSPNNYNYVREEIMLDDSVTTLMQVGSLGVKKKSMVTSYMDGLGRPMQTVSWRSSPDSSDVVQPIEYDPIGREAKKYLPYTKATTSERSGWYRKNAIKGTTDYNDSEQADFYRNAAPNIASDTVPFALSIFEPSPLNRVIEQGAPGAAWQPTITDHAIKKEYLFNAANEVLYFSINASGDIVKPSGSLSYYSANTLICNKTIDEHQNDVIEYVDNEGRTVCKKVKVETDVYASTYYLYDTFGNLVVVLPPEAISYIVNQN